MKHEKMKVHGLLLDVKSNPGKLREVDVDEGDLDEFYKILDCRLIDIVTYKIGGRAFDIVCDDEGALMESPIVSAISKRGVPMLVGNLFICNHYRDHLTSLSEADIDHILSCLTIVSGVKRQKDGSRIGDIHVHNVLTDVEYM